MTLASDQAPSSSTRPESGRAPLRLLYGLYVWGTFLVLALLALAAVLSTPGLDRRRRIARAVARLFLRLIGMPLTVASIERIPAGQCVIVSNHVSYLDGLAFTAALPPRFGFVIKREMAGVPLASAMLTRIGSEFVERFDRHKGAADARRVLRNASNGHSLVFFPEGTISQRSGLLKFHTGAFATAARARCPVVPVVIRGTRTALPAGSILPRPARIEIEFLPPIVVTTDEPERAAIELRDRARGAILEALQEPDLAG